MVNKSLSESNILICRQWWKVCWINGDRDKFYRKLYRRRSTGSPASSAPLQLKSDDSKKKDDNPGELLSDNDSGCDLEEYTWVPMGLTADEVHLYFTGMPEEKIPYVNSPGERYRLHQLIQQLPPQDSEARYCQNLTEEEKKELYLFSAERIKENLGRGNVHPVSFCLPCRNCQRILTEGSMCVTASRAGQNACWHPTCFVCSVCEELLVDLIYFYDNAQLFCGRHHAETLKPRCFACDEIILSEECTEAEGRAWHVNHFACLKCDKQLGGQHYIMKDERPCCLHCFDELFTEKCNACGDSIKFNDGQMSYEKQHWHATNKCFCCYTCGSSLLGHPFLPRKGLIYCSALCCNGEPASLENSSTVCKIVERGNMKELSHCRESKMLVQKSHYYPTKKRISLNDPTNLKTLAVQQKPDFNNDSQLESLQQGQESNLFKTPRHMAVKTPAGNKHLENEKYSCQKSYHREVRNGLEQEESLHQNFSDESKNILIVPHSVIDIKETKIFQRSILKKYSSFVENASFEKKENVLFTDSKNNDLLQMELQKSAIGYDTQYFSQTEDQSPSSFEFIEQSFPKKQLKVRFQCFIPEIKYADSVSRNQENCPDNSDSNSTCSTCSSSSGEDLSTYRLPQRREYGGIRISYVPNDAMACAKRHQENFSNLSLRKQTNDKHCIIS